MWTNATLERKAVDGIDIFNDDVPLGMLYEVDLDRQVKARMLNVESGRTVIVDLVWGRRRGEPACTEGWLHMNYIKLEGGSC